MPPTDKGRPAPDKPSQDPEFFRLVVEAEEARDRAYSHLLAWWKTATPADKEVFVAELHRLAGDPVRKIIGFAAIVGYQDMVLDVCRKAV